MYAYGRAGRYSGNGNQKWKMENVDMYVKVKPLLIVITF